MSAHPAPGETPVSTLGRAILLGIALCLISGFLVALQVSPDPRGYGTHQQLGLPPCMFRLITGYPCAGCGMTTSFAHFVRGHFYEAAHANPAGVLLATVLTIIIPWCGLSAWSGRLWLVAEPVIFGCVLTICLAVMTVLVWLIRLATFSN